MQYIYVKRDRNVAARDQGLKKIEFRRVKRFGINCSTVSFIISNAIYVIPRVSLYHYILKVFKSVTQYVVFNCICMEFWR